MTTNAGDIDFARVKLLSLDVDGVQTDGGGVLPMKTARFSRKFNVKDGVGIKSVMALGVVVAIISAGSPGSILPRAEKLGIRHVYTGVQDKSETLKRLAKELDIALEDVAHVGDDVNDIPLMELVGLPMSVADGMAGGQKQRRVM